MTWIVLLLMASAVLAAIVGTVLMLSMKTQERRKPTTAAASCVCGQFWLPMVPGYSGGLQPGWVIYPGCPETPHAPEQCPATWHAANNCGRAYVHMGAR